MCRKEIVMDDVLGVEQDVCVGAYHGCLLSSPMSVGARYERYIRSSIWCRVIGIYPASWYVTGDAM